MALTKAKFGVISSALASGNATDGYVLTADGSGNSAWEEASGGVAGISSSADATAITIDSSERVSIGHTTANADFQVSNAGAEQLEIYAGNASNVNTFQHYNRSTSNYVDAKHIANNHIFLSGGTEVFRTSGANVLIGKTAVNQTTTTGHEFTTGTTIYRAEFSTSNNEFIIFNNHSSPAGTASISFRYDNSQKGSIGLTSTAVSFNTSSDYRLKENVTYNWDATTRLKQLKPSRFNFIADADTTVDGFLAHEVSDIVPEAITGEKDATKTLSNVVLNSDNQIIGEDVSEDDWTAGKTGDDAIYPSDSTWEASHTIPVYQVIDQSKLVPLLVKTIQELEARITTLENA